MESLYVCLFSNGHIKVGRSMDPDVRIAQHAERVSCMGVKLFSSVTYPCKGPAEVAEAELIVSCTAKAKARHKNEWFEGLAFADVCLWAGMFASVIGPSPEPLVVDGEQPDFRAILARLKALSRTQVEIALYCGCGQPSISDIATGVTKDPSYSVGSALIRLLDLSQASQSAITPICSPSQTSN